MPGPKKVNGLPWWLIAIWVLMLVVGIQSYLLHVKSRPVHKKSVQKAAVISKPVKKIKTSAVHVDLPPGKIAIVLDDWGYNRTHCQMLEQIPAPLGIAILPGLSYSSEVIECSKAAGKTPMLHLPIEPHRASEKYAAEYLLTPDMPVPTVKKILDRILQEMKGVEGVNNHTGSKGTESLTLMTAILEDLKRRRLSFVDSFTSEKSVCLEVAERLKMKIARRDIFLDNENVRSSIEKQFARAVGIARKNGFALVIGHDRVLTLQIVREQVQKLSKEGIEFITIKDYIRQYEHSGN